MDSESLSDFFELDETGLVGSGSASPEDIFSVLEALESVSGFNLTTAVEEGCSLNSKKEEKGMKLVLQKSTSSSAALQDSENELESSRKRKRQKVNEVANSSHEEIASGDGQQRMSHITVERNRRKQMNEHLTVLRSLMPCFYVKRGDQASIIGGVVDYINELQQVLQSLEAKKQRKVYSEVLSPRIISPSPRSSPLSPRKPPLSPRLNLPISPRTPQPTSPYKPRLGQQPVGGYLSPTTNLAANHLEPSPPPSSSNSSTSSNVVDSVNELVANSRSPIADVEVKFSGANVLLKTVSPRIPGQAVKIISALEDLCLEVLHVNITTIDEKMLNSFTIKIGIECQLSADELAHLIQQTFL